jgi:hypothetical protein
MRAKIQVVGIRDLELTGSVVRASQYSERASRYSSGVKEFLVEVNIDHPNAQLRTGMTAQVTIECKRLSDVLLIPVQALYAHGDQHFCIVDPIQPELRQVKPGITNDKLVVVQTGLEGGETVSLNPRHYFDQVELPKLAKKDDATDAPRDRPEDRSEPSQNVNRQAGNQPNENRTGRQGRPPRNRPNQGDRQRTKKPQASGTPLASETSQQQKDDATVETASSDTAPVSAAPSDTTAPAATESDR